MWNALFSTVWLHKFKLRYGIIGKIDCGESGDVDCETVHSLYRSILVYVLPKQEHDCETVADWINN